VLLEFSKKGGKQVMFVLQCICPDFWPLFCMRLVGTSSRRYVLRKSQIQFCFIVILLYCMWRRSGMKCCATVIDI